jgi:hypothetical protein
MNTIKIIHFKVQKKAKKYIFVTYNLKIRKKTKKKIYKYKLFFLSKKKKNKVLHHVKDANNT